MPDQIRAAGIAAIAAVLPATSRAEELLPRDYSASPLAVLHFLAETGGSLDRHELVTVALTLGVILFGVITAVMLVRTRLRANATETTLREEVATLRAESDRFNAMLRSEPQVLVSWAAADNEPDIVGDTGLITNAAAKQRVLAFGSWLEPDKAQAMERATDALRANGESFTMPLMTLASHAVEADGRVIGGRAVLRLRDVTG